MLRSVRDLSNRADELLSGHDANAGNRLIGPRVLVTQAADSGKLAELLRARGINVLELPTIRIDRPEEWRKIDECLRQIETYDWIVVTSINSVVAVNDRMRTIGCIHCGPKVAAVGTGTARALHERSWNVDFIPTAYNGATLARELSQHTDLAGRRVLFPKGDIARSDLPDGLRSAGANVTEVVVYRTLPAEIDADAVMNDLRNGDVRVATFTSPSTVQYFALGLGVKSLEGVLSSSVRVVSIGPTTSSALRDFGRAPDREASVATMESLADAVCDEMKGIVS